MVKHFTLLSIIIFSLIFFFSAGQEVQASDVCTGVPISGSNYEVAADCFFDYYVSMVNGIEGGNLIIKANKTLTIHNEQVIVFNPGQRVSFEAGATLYINSGGRLSVGYVWLKDEDNNGYPATTTMAGRDDPGGSWKRRGEFKTAYGARSETWNLVSDIKYDFDDTNASVYPGTGCGFGRACDVNTDNGTCNARPVECLAACQRCDGTSTDAEYASTAGQVCSSGSWTTPSASVNCTTANECSGNCTRYTRYRGCVTTGTSCTATNQVSSAAQYAPTAGQVCSSGSWTTPSASVNCTTVYECSGNCRRVPYYQGCVTTGTSCTATNRVTGTAINCGSGTACSGGTCSSSNYCAIGAWTCSGDCSRYYTRTWCDGSNNCSVAASNVTGTCGSGTRCSGGNCVSTGSCYVTYTCADVTTKRTTYHRCNSSGSCTQSYSTVDFWCCNPDLQTPRTCHDGECSGAPMCPQ